MLQKQGKAEESEPKVKKRIAKAPTAPEATSAPEEEAKPKAQIIRKAKPKEVVAKEEDVKVAKETAPKASDDLEILAKPIFRDEPAPSAAKAEEPAPRVKMAEPIVSSTEEAQVRVAPKTSARPSKEVHTQEVAAQQAQEPVVSKPVFEESKKPQDVKEQESSLPKSGAALEESRLEGAQGSRGPGALPGSSYQERGPRPAGSGYQDRGPRPAGSGYQDRGPRPAGSGYQDRGPRPAGSGYQDRGPRPAGSGYQDRGPRPAGSGYQDRGPRPEGSGYQDRGPRPAGSGYQDRGPRPAGSGYQDRGPRPAGSGYQDRGPRPASGDGAPRRESTGPMTGGERKPFRIRESFSDRQARSFKEQQERFQQQQGDGQGSARPRLGPTGRHFRDLVPQTPPADVPIRHTDQEKASRAAQHSAQRKKEGKFDSVVGSETEQAPSRHDSSQRTFDRSKPTKGIKKAADRPVLDTTGEEDGRWRKKRAAKKNTSQVDETIRPSSLLIHLPITVKDLAQEMKLKASQLIAKLFMQGVAVTLNDALDDETTVQLLGQEFGCEISIDRSEDERLQITNKTVAEEITGSDSSELMTRPPVVAFMGHVDHGKTSLIDAIRQSNRVAGEAGAITQHIGAFSCHTKHGPLTVLDTPGHEAFAAMRERGAAVTDVIVLVIAGDEGIKPQTDEAIRHARSVNATILVAINKCDKPNFNVDNVYRQLADRELLPEAWGGPTVTVNCSAATGEGIDSLLEMLALQAEVLELTANPSMRARGAVIEAELHKGLGNVATVLVQNGTLRRGDALVFSQSWGRVKTMKDEFGLDIDQAGPSHAARITGLSSLPEAGENFIVVSSEREAREIAEDRAEKIRQKQIQTRKKVSMETLMQQTQGGAKKTLHCILRADVQGSVEALRFELLKIHSDKVDINVINQSIGEISESDVELAAASGSVIIGFHTRIEAHAESLIKALNVKVKQFDVIYHAVDGVKEMMAELLDKIAEEHYRGRIEVKATFKSSQLGKIAGCQVADGNIHRSHRMRVIRDSKTIWEGTIASLRRGKDDVREVSKGFECGVLLNGFSDFEPGDILEAFEIVYRAQSL